MLTKKLMKLELLKKEFNKFSNEKHLIKKHYPLFENDKKIENINLNFSNDLKFLSLNMSLNIENEFVYPSFIISKKGNGFEIDTQIRKTFCESYFLLNNEKKLPTIEENIQELKNQAKHKLLIAEHFEFLKTEIFNSAGNIFNFYMKFFNTNVIKKENINKEIENLYNEISTIYREKIKTNFDFNNSDSFEDFVLQKANCQSFSELKDKYNNKDPIELPIVYSKLLSYILNTENILDKEYIINRYSDNEDLLKSELIMLTVKNNRLYFRSANIVGREEAEYIFNKRVLFRNKPCDIDTKVQLKNGEIYHFFLQEEDLPHVAFSKPNSKRKVFFEFLDNI